MKCRFEYYASPGDSLEFTYRIGEKGKAPIEKIRLEDGKEYELPSELFYNINNSGEYSKGRIESDLLFYGERKIAGNHFYRLIEIEDK
jgi:hypothetical protein